MVLSQHARFYTRFAILFLITSTTILYYATSKKESISLKTPFYEKQIASKSPDKQYFKNVTKVKTIPVTNEKFDGKVYSFGNRIEKIKLAVVLCGERLNQTVVTLKSAVIFSRKSLHFIIIVDDINHALLKQKLLEWPSAILERLSFEIHPINFPNGSEGDEWKKLFKLCACQRLFLPSILHHIDSLLYVDTDVLFLRPVEELWEHFYRMNSSHIAALCPEHEDFATGWYNRFARHPFYEPLGVNSGVMLMNLTRMRTFQWETYLPSIMKEYRLNIVWGDQDIINIIFHFHPEKLYLFPCEWNFRPDHCMYSNVCKTAEKNGIAVIHGNRGVFLNNKQPAFKAIFQAMLQYNLEDDPILHFLEPVKLYLKQTVNTNCGKYLSTVISSIHPKILEKTSKR